MLTLLSPIAIASRNQVAWAEAAAICDEDVVLNQAIGQHGLALIENAQKNASQNAAQTQVFNILTHCNAGWLATVDFGTALSPIYAAHNAGLKVHVWVDETRPRNQGASLTAWELAQHGVPHTVISDNAGGHLMQQGLVDMVIVGADRVTSTGDVCNKIGTYLKALAAFDNHIPFYAAVPSPTIDWAIANGLEEIEIEQRHGDEVAYMQGLAADGSLQSVRVIPSESATANPAFDVTPARLVTGIITEYGVFSPDQLVKYE
jgi:methylthioribose-1-phosphate isomerase